MSEPPIRVAVLGSTGSIGRQTLDVIRAHPGRFQVVGLAARRNAALLQEQLAEFRPRMFCCSSGQDLERFGAEHVDLETMARDPEVDVVLDAVVGGEGLRPALATLLAGKALALANKEAMVMAGPLLKEAAARGGGEIRPVDSEHSAIWQCLAGEDPACVRRLILTASGGALRDLPLPALSEVRPEEALSHPTWQMGRRITIDSATLFNKGMEVIEARWLFDIPFESIQVLQQRESIVHSLVELVDGSLKAQLSLPDMRLPIQFALSYPRRLPLDLEPVDFVKLGQLSFGALDPERYPCLGLALAAGARGGTYPAAIAAADEEAVEAFLEGRIRFLDIPRLLACALDAHKDTADPDLETVLEADAWGRSFARRWIEERQ